MPGASVSLVLTAEEPALRRAGGELFPECGRCPLSRADLRPAEPFIGPLFALLSGQPRGACVGVIVPVVRVIVPVVRGGQGDGAAMGDAGPLVAIADHINLELRSPLTGRWPAGVPRDFPSMSGIYQPDVVRARGGPRVYSSGVVAAGVADARQLTPFESRAIRDRGVSIVSDSLVPVTIIAAYYGLRLAACGVLQAPEHDRE